VKILNLTNSFAVKIEQEKNKNELARTLTESFKPTSRTSLISNCLAGKPAFFVLIKGRTSNARNIHESIGYNSC